MKSTEVYFWKVPSELKIQVPIWWKARFYKHMRYNLYNTWISFHETAMLIFWPSPVALLFPSFSFQCHPPSKPFAVAEAIGEANFTIPPGIPNRFGHIIWKWESICIILYVYMYELDHFSPRIPDMNWYKHWKRGGLPVPGGHRECLWDRHQLATWMSGSSSRFHSYYMVAERRKCQNFCQA